MCLSRSLYALLHFVADILKIPIKHNRCINLKRDCNFGDGFLSWKALAVFDKRYVASGYAAGTGKCVSGHVAFFSFGTKPFSKTHNTLFPFLNRDIL